MGYCMSGSYDGYWANALEYKMTSSNDTTFEEAAREIIRNRAIKGVPEVEPDVAKLVQAHQADLDRVYIDAQKHYEAVCEDMVREARIKELQGLNHWLSADGLRWRRIKQLTKEDKK